MRDYRPHRLIIPFTAMLALVLCVALFHALDGRVSPQKAVYIAALISFALTAVIGIAFKPMLGE